VPSFFKTQFYHNNVDRDFQKIIKQKFPIEYEEHLQNKLRAKMDETSRFKFELEVGFYFNGYENPSNVYDYSQKTKQSEWTVFIRARNPQFRPLIS